MRPYLAVLADSFHAALSSRVLWIAMLAIWMLLAVLAPIGYREDYTTDFRNGDFQNGTRLKAMLAKGLVFPDSVSPAVSRLARALPVDLKRDLQRVGEGDEVRIRISVLSAGLNSLLDDESWYDSVAWDSAYRLKELRRLDATTADQLSDSQRRRRARLRIESVLPGVFQTRSSRSIMVTYAGLDFPVPVAVDQAQFETVINQFVMPFIIDWALGFALVLLGILVTASIIPDMLQPGSLHLLLSKPISRPLLLLSKFVGGCAFVFLCVVQLIVGLYLIAGLRLDLWNERLLLCIPVSVFCFAVFYSISLVAGLRWRSPILAIGVTVMCGTFLLLVGYFGSIADEFIQRPNKLRGVTIVDDTLFAATGAGGLVRFDRNQNQWVDAIEANGWGTDRVLAPIRLSDGAVATAVVKDGLFNPFGSGPLDLLVLGRSNQWKPEPSVRLPTGTQHLFNLDGQTVMAMNTSDLAVIDAANVLSAAGLAEPIGDQATPANSSTSTAQRSENLLNKLSNMMGGATTGFEKILPGRVSMTAPRDIAIGPTGDWLIGTSRGQLFRLHRTADGPWSVTVSRTLPGEASARGVIALSDQLLLVARADNPIQFFSAETLEPQGEANLGRRRSVIAAAGLDAARFVLLTDDGRCRVVARQTSAPNHWELRPPLPVRDAHALDTDRLSNRLIVVHHVDQIDLFNLDTLSMDRSIRPTPTRWRMVDRYIMSPLRMIVPQTGELGETIASIISGKSGVTISGGPDQGEIIRYDVFRPVVSCATFIIVMLTIGCVYFSTRDF